ncbi:hypothetical protein ACIBG0_35130 [Nocardia sp. NPDC050630]|uniref:hypothetical protein n=1 Tax=Nocardia sp. NPDC050630 TaxID=3364321 RepID=UPI0037ADDEA9
MEFSDRLRDVRRRPGNYGLDGSYREFVAFVNGADAVTDWTLLDGFRAWLAQKLGQGSNLVWWELVRQICAHEQHIGRDDIEDAHLTNRALELIDEFLKSKSTQPV